MRFETNSFLFTFGLDYFLLLFNFNLVFCCCCPSIVVSIWAALLHGLYMTCL